MTGKNGARRNGTACVAPVAMLTPGQSFYFDACRGISAQLVLIGHALNVTFPAIFMLATRDGGLTARPGLPYVQNLGVLVFFLLSGFLVTGSALRKSADRQWGLPQFLADRFARIFTPLIPALLIICVVDTVLAHHAGPSRISDLNSGPADLAINLLMLSGNPGMAFLARLTGIDGLASGAFGSADQLWTVMIEWWIYVLFGMGYFAMLVRRRHSTLGWLILLALLTAALGTIAGAAVTAPGLLLAWAIGMAACLARQRLAQVPPRVLSGLAAGASLAAIALLIGGGWHFYALHSAALLGIAFFAVCFRVRSGQAAPPPRALRGLVRHLSNVSYSLYLVHLSLIVWAQMLFQKAFSGPVAFVGALLVANLVAWLFYLTFERHYPCVRRWIDPAVTLLDRALTPRQRTPAA